MLKKKRILLVALVCVACMSSQIFASGQKEAASDKKSDDVIVIEMAHDNNPGDPVTVACEYWAKILEERSQGKMIIKTYPSGQLGSKNDLLDQMFAGEPIMVIANGPYCADRGVADLGIMQAPYLFSSWSQLRALMDSDWGKLQEKKLHDIGMQVVADNWQYGVRHTLTTKPVKTPEDLKGMKIRTQGSTIHVEGFKCLGATPTPMTLSEVYTSLQQKVIDGLENPLSVLYSGKFQEVAKYLALDGHIYDLSFIVIGSGVFDKLTPEQQQLLLETGREAGEKQNELAAKADVDCLAKLKADGVTVTDVDVKRFQDAAKSFYDDKDITGKWSPNLLENVQKIIGNN
ncbi:MAG: C4-dicarboxylate TRAP transporter substrate-binding protein [Sphaerochaetaceae bacterium]